jgi:hypothetical protein
MIPIHIEHAQIMRLFRPDGLWFWIWNGIVTAMMVLSVLFVYSRKSRWTRGRRLLAIELRLEAAWERTKTAMQIASSKRPTPKERALLADVRPGLARDWIEKRESTKQSW